MFKIISVKSTYDPTHVYKDDVINITKREYLCKSFDEETKNNQLSNDCFIGSNEKKIILENIQCLKNDTNTKKYKTNYKSHIKNKNNSHLFYKNNVVTKRELNICFDKINRTTKKQKESVG
jgi:hypothetical protein